MSVTGCIIVGVLLAALAAFADLNIRVRLSGHLRPWVKRRRALPADVIDLASRRSEREEDK